MRVGTRFSLIDVESARHRAKLAIEGRGTGISVDGLLLDAQFDVGEASGLLFLTEDSPYDEGLHVYLVDGDGMPEDAVEAGSTFGAGILEIQEVGERYVDLRFFKNDVTYRLEIDAQPSFQFRLPTGWHYKKKLSRHRLRVTSRRGNGRG